MRLEIPSSTLSLVLSNLQEMRLLMRSDLKELPLFNKLCIQLLGKTRQEALNRDLLKMSAMDKTVTRELYMFLLSCHDEKMEEFVDSIFKDFEIDRIELVMYCIVKE